MLSPIEQLTMVTHNELRVSYVYMLQYVYDHKVDILRNIDLPQVIDDIHHLTLTSNSVRQLNIVNNYSYYQGKHVHCILFVMSVDLWEGNGFSKKDCCILSLIPMS